MTRLAVALDLGTSGFRAQSIDLAGGEILATVITTRHPLPGGNVMDQLNFAMNRGVATAQALIIRTINRMLAALRVEPADIARLALCGNPNQLSLFQGMEIRDLAFAGRRKLASLGVVYPERRAAVVAARTLPGLRLAGDCEVIIPPAVRHEVGADGLAMLLVSRALKHEGTAIVTDFGTNAEIALIHKGTVFLGSTAAGPALEGQQISCGRLAAPWVIADLEPSGDYHRLILLGEELLPVAGGLVDLAGRDPVETNPLHPAGITGTGTIALVDQALRAGLIELPRIMTADRRLHLGEKVFFTEEDLAEAGKAIGAVRAGYLTLCREAGISPADIDTAFLTGASGTSMDAAKAHRLGLIPPCVRRVYQMGNTSLAMARRLAADPRALDAMGELADRIRARHVMFAASPHFQKAFILELSLWTEGMPAHQHRHYLKKFGLADLPPVQGAPEIARTVQRDIDDLGRMGLTTIHGIDRK